MKRIFSTLPFLVLLINLSLNSCNYFKKSNAASSSTSDSALLSTANANLNAQFLFISDVHVDSTRAESTYGKDTRMDLWKKFMQKADSVAVSSKAKFIVYTGDLPAHYGKYYLDPKVPFNKSAIQSHDTDLVVSLNGLRQIADRNHIPLFYAQGNNDAIAGDYFPFNYKGSFPPFSLINQSFNPYPALNVNSASTPPCIISMPNPNMCYYSASPVAGLVLIMMNTVMLTGNFEKNVGTAVTHQLADAQFAWLDQQLKSAKTNNQKVYIAMHVPPGINLYPSNPSDSSNWINDLGPTQKQSYNDQFLDLINTYNSNPNQRLIEAVLYGHTHMDELRLLMNKNSTVVSGIAISAPGITPLYQNNPGFKTVTYDNNTKSLMDFTTNYTTLRTAVQIATNPKAVNPYYGNLSYSFNKQFGNNSNKSIADLLSSLPLSTIADSAKNYYTVKNPPIPLAKNIMASIKVCYGARVSR